MNSRTLQRGQATIEYIYVLPILLLLLLASLQFIFITKPSKHSTMRLSSHAGGA
jgi:hypothetical protein